MIKLTTELRTDDVIMIEDGAWLEVWTDPVPTDEHGRWTFMAMDVATHKVEQHAAQPHFDWEVRDDPTV